MKNTYKQPVNRIVQQDVPKPINRFIQHDNFDNKIVQQEQKPVNRFINVQQEQTPINKIVNQNVVQQHKPIHTVQPQQNKSVHTLQPQQIELLHQLKAQQASPLQYIHESMWCLVVKKRNIALEKQNYENIEKNDIYEIVSFNTTNKGASIAFVNYKPINTAEWRIIAKYVKKIPYNNVNFNIDTCPTFNETKY